MGNESKSNSLQQSSQPQTILVVDDDDGVRNLTAEVLELCGYQVLKASNGQEAIEVCHLSRRSIQLLVTDVWMPKMGGVELMERLAETNDSMSTLYMSGYSEEQVEKFLPGAVPFIRKPFSLDALLSAVSNLLIRSD